MSEDSLLSIKFIKGISWLRYRITKTIIKPLAIPNTNPKNLFKIESPTSFKTLLTNFINNEVNIRVQTNIKIKAEIIKKSDLFSIGTIFAKELSKLDAK